MHWIHALTDLIACELHGETRFVPIYRASMD
jgi:hypothetical protein